MKKDIKINNETNSFSEKEYIFILGIFAPTYICKGKKYNDSLYVAVEPIINSKGKHANDIKEIVIQSFLEYDVDFISLNLKRYTNAEAVLRAKIKNTLFAD